MEEILSIRDKAAVHLENTGYIPASLFAKTEQMLSAYRNLPDQSSADKAPDEMNTPADTTSSD
jgi:hypothetical protein